MMNFIQVYCFFYQPMMIDLAVSIGYFGHNLQNTQKRLLFSATLNNKRFTLFL